MRTMIFRLKFVPDIHYTFTVRGGNVCVSFHFLCEVQSYPQFSLRGIFDHIIRLTAYPKRQRRNRLSAPMYEEL